jgi:hypothetical protein
MLGLGLAALLVPACHDGGDGETPGGPPSRDSTEVRAVLRGAQVAPPVATLAEGTAELRVDGTRTSIDFTLRVEGLSSLTAARLHVGAPGEDGPALFTLASAPFTSPRSGVLTAPDLSPAPSQGIDTFADAAEAILEGRTYVEVRTLSHPDGEIRGHVGPITLRATLDGARQVPPVLTGASGFAFLALSDDQRELQITLSASGLSGPPSGAHLHVGATGIVGPAFLNLAPGPFALPLTAILTPVQIVPQPFYGIETFDDAVSALLSGNAYLDVHTAAFPDGEIRGQAGP